MYSNCSSTIQLYMIVLYVGSECTKCLAALMSFYLESSIWPDAILRGSDKGTASKFVAISEKARRIPGSD
jgi:hypothetical protein